MAIPGHEFLTAHFSNNDRTIVEAYWTTPDGKETRVEYIEAKEGDPSWENLLTHMDIDTLHESTYGVAPGQFGVIYQGTKLVGGGRISSKVLEKSGNG